VTVIPARDGPSQNCLPSTDMFPEAGTTRSNSTAPGVGANGGRGRTRSGLGGSGDGAGAAARAAGSRNGNASRSCCGTGANRSAGEAMSRD